MGISTGPIVAGIDIGYGNLKVVGGEAQGSARREIVLPAGAAPVDALPRLHDRADLKGGELVLLRGAEWAAGVDQIHIQNGARKTHEHYSTEPEYEALFLAGLARLGYDHIHTLVTGVPVSAFYGPEGDSLKSGIIRLMQGRKHVSSSLSVTVDRVVVVPQPFGTFMSLASLPGNEDLRDREDLFGLVFDPGYFSVDWVCMDGQSVMHRSSGSSQLATSHILEEAARHIAAQTGAKVNADRLDMVLRRGYETLSVGAASVDYRAVLGEVGHVVGDKVAAVVQSTVRNINRGIDYIVLTGGGSWLYAPSLERAFPNSRVLAPADPVLANALGYFAFAQYRTLPVDRRAGVAA